MAYTNALTSLRAMLSQAVDAASGEDTVSGLDTVIGYESGVAMEVTPYWGDGFRARVVADGLFSLRRENDYEVRGGRWHTR
jgi:hypothetical protein